VLKDEVARLRDEDGLTWVEIAEKVGRSEGTCRYHYGVAKKLLATGKIEIKGSGNIREIKGPMAQVRTLDDLVEFSEIDLEEWSITKWIANYWGQADSPNSQVKAWLARTSPIALKPVLSPVEVKIGKIVEDRDRPVGGLKRAMVLFDPHFGFEKSLRTGKLTPYHDRGALDVALQFALWHRPDVIVFGGDILDLADWSDKFARSPNMYWTTQPSALEAAWWLGQFRACTKEMYVMQGNHDERMNRKVIEHLKEGFGLRSVDGMDLPPLLSVPRLLGLHTMGIEYVGDWPDGEIWLNPSVRVEHGSITRGKSGQTATAIVEGVDATTAFGHVHRIEMAYKTIWGNGGARQISAFSPGCLCRTDGVVPGNKARQNWQQGIGMIDFLDTGEHRIEIIPIENGRAMYAGEWVIGRARVGELVEATGWQY